jgi:hypothetical protein
MIVAAVVLETVAGAGPRVAARLLRVPGLSLTGGDGASRLAAVWEGPDGEALQVLAERLLAADPELLGIFPTFVGTCEER